MNPQKSISALWRTCPYPQNAPCIFDDLSFSALMACNFAPFEEVKVSVSNSAESFQKKGAPLRIFKDVGVVRVLMKHFLYRGRDN